jgi:hypothetical protein
MTGYALAFATHLLVFCSLSASPAIIISHIKTDAPSEFHISLVPERNGLKMLIAIDHGNSSIKTVNHSFPSTLERHANKPPMATDILEYDGAFWTMSGQPYFIRYNY